MKILHKYVLKEHLGPLLFSLSALTSVLLLNYVSRKFGELVGKGLPWTAIAEFFALSIPFTVALTLPMAVLVATLYAFSRLAAENEITALKASGVSMPDILRPVLVAAFGMTLIMLFFNDQILPRTNHELATLLSDIAQTKPTFALREQVINEVTAGKLYLRTNHLEERSNRMREVTIYDMSDATRRRTIYADSGTLSMASNRKDLLMRLYHGYMLDVPTTKPSELQRLFFTTDLIRVPGVANQFQASSTNSTKGNREMSVCEMQHEVSDAERRYVDARNSFLRNVATARAHGIRLSSEITKTKTPRPMRYSLGQAYCSMLHALGVRSLGAQGVQQKPPPAPKPVPPIIGKITVESVAGGRGGDGAAAAQHGRLGAGGGQIGTRLQAPSPSPTASALAREAASAPPPTPPSQALTPSIIDSDRSRMMDAQTAIASYEVEIHKKFAISVACFIFVMLGAPIALRFPRGGVGLTIGVSLFVFALYYVGLIAGASLATHGYVPAAVSMWAANIIFGVVAIILLKRMGREASTARGGDVREVLDTLSRKIKELLRRQGLLHNRRADEDDSGEGEQTSESSASVA